MKMMVLEDMPDRILWFAQWCMDNQWSLVVANDAADAKVILNTIQVDVIFLDHDLGGRVYVERHEENTGYTLCSNGWGTINEAVPVVIHSWNYDGSTSMARKLQENGYRGSVAIAPFNEEEFTAILSKLAQLTKDQFMEVGS